MLALSTDSIFRTAPLCQTINDSALPSGQGAGSQRHGRPITVRHASAILRRPLFVLYFSGGWPAAGRARLPLITDHHPIRRARRQNQSWFWSIRPLVKTSREAVGDAVRRAECPGTASPLSKAPLLPDRPGLRLVVRYSTSQQGRDYIFLEQCHGPISHGAAERQLSAAAEPGHLNCQPFQTGHASNL